MLTSAFISVWARKRLIFIPFPPCVMLKSVLKEISDVINDDVIKTIRLSILFISSCTHPLFHAKAPANLNPSVSQRTNVT